MDHNSIDRYKKVLNENIFSVMELMKAVTYTSILIMPVFRFESLLKWKADLEEQKERMLDEINKKKILG